VPQPEKMVPGVVLALLTTPVLAAEQKQSNELTLGGGVDVAPYYSGSDKSRVTTALVVDYAMANGFFVSTHARSRLRQQHRQI
jgi:outer membrane scaffolding protein for murein synthesis (MipA/OmpV family)